MKIKEEFAATILNVILKKLDMEFKDKTGITFGKLPITKINEAAEFIYNTYQKEGIWLNYTLEETIEELMCSFSNLVYRPTYFVAYSPDNKIIGIGSYLWSHCSSNVFELSFGTVHPDYQRRGIGQYLTYLRLKEIVDGHSDAIIITVARRPKLFEKFNFKTVCKIKNEDEDSDFMICSAIDINFDDYGKI